MKKCLECKNCFEDAEWLCPACGWKPDEIGGHLAFAPGSAESDGGYEASFFGRLYEIESGSFWFRARNRLILWVMTKYFTRAEIMLEVGCGTGFVLSAIRETKPGMKLCGSDIYIEGVEYAAKRMSDDIDLFQMDARSIPFSEEFDVIGAFDMLEHVREDTGLLREMHDALKTGGGVILTVPQHSWLWCRHDEVSCHVRRYSAAELRSKLIGAGFEVACMISFVSLLFPLMMVSRVIMTLFPRGFDAAVDLEFGILDFVFDKIMTIERILIKMGIRFPFGGSLLVVARKKQ